MKLHTAKDRSTREGLPTLMGELVVAVKQSHLAAARYNYQIQLAGTLKYECCDFF